MKIENTVITPEFARLLLEKNTNNRNVRRSHVAAIARDMRAGDFVQNGDAIRISVSGELIDGQHRLLACIEAGVPFPSLLISGIADEAKQSIDTGRARTAADRFKFEGMHNAAAVSASIRTMAIFAKGSTSIPPLTAAEMDRIAHAHPGLQRSAVISRHVKISGFGTKLSAAHYIMSTVYGDDVGDEYLNVWKTGVPFFADCPAHLLRERIIRTQGQTTAIKPAELINLLAVSMNKFGGMEGVRVLKPGSNCAVRGWTEGKLWHGPDHRDAP